jgi:TRAP-type C4-dicarboxylate transport system permease small subunit
MKLLEKLNLACIGIAAASVIIISVAGGLDVLTTTLLHMPIPAVYESTETLLVMTIFLSLGYLQLKDQNIAVDILSRRMGHRGKKLQSAVVQIISLVFFSILTWQALHMFIESWKIREYSIGLVAFPIYPSKLAVVIGAGITAITSIYKFIQIVSDHNNKIET